jgi:hypothetical protein
MKSLWLTVTTVFLASAIFGQVQPKTIPVPSNTILKLSDFSMRMPSGEAWRMTKPDENAEEIRFENSQLKAEITVEKWRLTDPIPNVQEKLAQLAQAAEKVFSRHGRLIVSEYAVTSVPGAECLYLRIIIDSPEFSAPGPTRDNLAMHTLECIYGPDHLGKAEFRYTYPTQGSADPQQNLAKEFFAGIAFKLSSPQ